MDKTRFEKIAFASFLPHDNSFESGMVDGERNGDLLIICLFGQDLFVSDATVRNLVVDYLADERMVAYGLHVSDAVDKIRQVLKADFNEAREHLEKCERAISAFEHAVQ